MQTMTTTLVNRTRQEWSTEREEKRQLNDANQMRSCEWNISLRSVQKDKSKRWKNFSASNEAKREKRNKGFENCLEKGVSQTISYSIRTQSNERPKKVSNKMIVCWKRSHASTYIRDIDGSANLILRSITCCCSIPLVFSAVDDDDAIRMRESLSLLCR